MAADNGILLVEALYSFKGKNNDELCFSKGDIITVTQKEEGGWWEGTFNDKTGWFPSNYVKEYKLSDGGCISPQPADADLISPQHSQQQQIYRNLVLKDILESERNHVADLQGLLGSHLASLRKAELLSEAEYKQLVGNLEEVTLTHSHLVSSLEEQSDRPSRDQRIGGAFLTMAPQLQNAHKIYCTNHPLAVCMLEKYKDELNSFMECQGATRPGIMVLTTALSKPFRRLDKYTGMLQEYERHLEEGHPDRGDTQRSSHVYKDLASICGAIRRQKELELEVVTGRVHGWDGGETLGTLGEIIRMGSVAFLPDHQDRYLVLFPTVLIMLAVSPRMSAFIFEGSYPLSSIQVSKLEDSDHHKNAFEISGPMAEHIVAVCQTQQDQLQWVEALSQHSRMARSSNFTPNKSSLTSPPVPPAHVSVRSSNPGAIVFHSLSQPPMCMSCGLPYYPVGECTGSMKVGGFDGNGHCHLQRASCQCTTPPVRSSSFSMSCPVCPTLSVLPSATFYVSRPYAILTKYITNMYRRKLITRKLLRQLAGDREDENELHVVRLRRHKTECSIRTGDESSNESEVESKNTKIKKLSYSEERSETSNSSSDGGYWVGEEPEDGLGALSPIPKKKQYPNISSTASSNLHKWRYQQSLTDNRFNSSLYSSGESGVSTDGSNPYGYVRYYNPENSSVPNLKVENLHYERSTKCYTYTKPYSVERENFINDNREQKSSSCDEYLYYLPNNNWPAVSSVQVDESHSRQNISLAQISKVSQNKDIDVAKSLIKQDSIVVRPTYKFFKVKPGRARHDSECYVMDNNTNPVMCSGFSCSKSLPMINSNLVLQDKFNDSQLKTTHSSTLNIPAAPIILPSFLPSDSDNELTESSPNICDRTIYEASTSSDDALGLEGMLVDSRHQKKVFPFKTKPDVAYYVSSCSGDETGEDRIDYYESHRKQVPMMLPLSQSEPNLWRRIPSTRHHTEMPKFSSHYVQMVHSVENPAKVCNCESHSHRSSDSGLADVIHHLECCPLRSETPGLGRGSSVSRCSHSSQFSTVKSSRSTSSCQIRPFTPDCSADTDILFLTPTTTPYTSAPVSYAEDSLSSLIDSVTLHHSTSANELSCISCLEPPREESVFRSGLYAHWWMKASVCPKALALDKSKKDYLRFRIDKKPEVPPKPKFLKPSYHIRRGGTKGAITKPTSRSASTQTNFTSAYQPVKLQVIPQVSSSCLKHNSLCSTRSGQSEGDQSVRPKLRMSSTHLSPQTSVTMSRDRSFESQASQISQVTVIPRPSSARGGTSTESQCDQLTLPVKANLSTLEIQSKHSQESSGTSGNSCTELSSLHSFSESCERDGNPPHLRDSSEGLDVDFHRRASSHSLHVDVAPTDAFKSTLYWQLQPFPCISSQKFDSGNLKTSKESSALGISDSADEGHDKPVLPPKPPHLQSWPIKRSKSLPRLPLASISIHNQSKDFAS